MTTLTNACIDKNHVLIKVLPDIVPNLWGKFPKYLKIPEIYTLCVPEISKFLDRDFQQNLQISGKIFVSPERALLRVETPCIPYCKYILSLVQRKQELKLVTWG